ncbi:hypothetical protein PTTG_27091 [Puccinia triticina 1-1 BBBD Race 1]|uniref:Uncharacterized protein n=1 Tax=Puccinia triticina (isolate 1-1 / race 1 (BBBD)) TaxID=630390 RepID=A0A180GNV0_PUCT1|nr:hypothetical protein PTTG_27091 [Puccinia triticina 1-1 BBBD Race 1]
MSDSQTRFTALPQADRFWTGELATKEEIKETRRMSSYQCLLRPSKAFINPVNDTRTDAHPFSTAASLE